MDEYAIKVDDLSKRYVLGQNSNADGIRHVLEDIVRYPMRLLSGAAKKEKIKSEFWALEDVSFEINPGEVVGFIGRNGAGKSTLLKLLSRITEPTTGEININGRVASLLEVGTGFHPELSGRENIYLNGAILGMAKSEIQRKFDDIVEFAEVSKFLDTPVKRYSSGMYVRLAFAVAAHLEPEILIVDEVLAVGDAEFQAKCIGKMEDVATKGGRTVLFVSHNMAAVQNLCTRGILLEKGRVVCDGPTAEVLEEYSSRTQKRAQQELATRTDRTGDGDAIVEKLSLLDVHGNEMPAASTGQDVILRVFYRVKPSVRFRGECYIDVSIERDTGVLFIVSTAFPPHEQLVLEGSGYIDFKIPRLPLSEATYHMNTFIRANNVIQDWVQDAALLEVVGGDYFGTGRNCHAGWNGRYVLTPHTWTHSGK